MLKKLIIFFIFLFSLLFFPSSAFASTFYLSPSKTSVASGATVSVSVRLNTSGESINGVSAYLSYPTNLLEVTSLSYGGAFSIAAEGTYGGGGVRISRGSITGAVGDLTVATIRFRGKTQGTANVSFIGGSAAVRTSDSSDSLAGTSGAVITVGPPQAGGTATTTEPTPGSKAASSDVAKPIINNIAISETSTISGTITFETNEKADSLVEYGLEKDEYFLEISDKELVTKHSVKLEGPLLTPGVLLHFRVKSKDQAGNEAISEDRTFRLKGYTVTIKLTGKENNPIADTEVFLYTEPLRSTTNSSGEVVFTDVTSGKHLLVVKLKNGAEKTQEIFVEENLLSQNFALTIDDSKKSSTDIALYILLFAIIALVVGGFVYWKKMEKSQE